MDRAVERGLDSLLARARSARGVGHRGGGDADRRVRRLSNGEQPRAVRRRAASGEARAAAARSAQRGDRARAHHREYDKTNSAAHAHRTNANRAPMSSMCVVPPAFGSPKRRKTKYNATPPTAAMNVPAIRPTVSAR